MCPWPLLMLPISATVAPSDMLICKKSRAGLQAQMARGHVVGSGGRLRQRKEIPDWGRGYLTHAATCLAVRGGLSYWCGLVSASGLEGRAQYFPVITRLSQDLDCFDGHVYDRGGEKAEEEHPRHAAIQGDANRF